MGQIKITDLDGKQRSVNAEAGVSLMELMYDDNVPIKAACFGCCSCSTCHVYIDEAWVAKIPPASAEEEDILDMVQDLQENRSRLSCQIIYNNDLDGLELTLAEDTRPD